MDKSRKCAWTIPTAWLVLVLGLLMSFSVQAGDNKLQGSWEVVGTPDPASMVDPFVNLSRMSADGGIINVDPNEGAAVGDWKYLGAGNYSVTFRGFLPGGSGLRFKVESVVQVSQGGGQFTGPFVTDVTDENGNAVFSFGGQVSATRL